MKFLDLSNEFFDVSVFYTLLGVGTCWDWVAVKFQILDNAGLYLSKHW